MVSIQENFISNDFPLVHFIILSLVIASLIKLFILMMWTICIVMQALSCQPNVIILMLVINVCSDQLEARK